MRRLLTFLIASGLLSLSLLAQAQPATPSLLQVIETDPPAGQEVDLSASLLIYFDSDLDCASAQEAISFSPQVAFEVSCDGPSLTIRPQGAFQRATRYTLTIGDALRSADGGQLLESFRQEFNTVGFLRVAQALPTLDAAVAPDAPLTIVFNRPVAPLGMASDAADAPNPIANIEPATEGQGEWVNTSVYRWQPSTLLAAGLEYTVTLDPELKAADGAPLEGGGYSWSFRTEVPVLVEALPNPDSTSVALTEAVQLRFNVPMDQASVEANFSLRTESGEQVAGELEWAEDGMGLRFTPAENLALDTVYNVSIGTGSRGLGGGLPITETLTDWRFVTVPRPAIIRTNPQDGAVDASPYGGFEIGFASIMNYDTLLDKFTIEPKPWRDPDFYYYDWDNSLRVSFPTEPDTQYTITIAPGMEDVYGNRIETPFSFSYITGSYGSEYSLRVPDYVGFYNAEREPTALFLTHLNVSQLNLSLYSIDPTSLARFLTERNNRSNDYDPANTYDSTVLQLLRQWTIPSVAPRNVLRYEYLALGQTQEASTECPGALPTRLKVGDQAIVISQPEPVRARSAPQTGDILELLYRSYTLPIVGGPNCLDGVLWWEVQLRDERRAWVAEAVEGEYLLDVRLAAQQTPVQVTDADGGKLPPGVYFLEVGAPELNYKLSHFMVVSSFNVTFKAGIDELLAWVTDAQTGQPVADVDIIFYRDNLNVLGQARTDADGLARLSYTRRDSLYVPIVAVARSGDSFGMGSLEWSRGVDPWAFDVNSDFYPRRYTVYAYTDRPVYRPGQPVYYRGVVRLRDDVRYLPADLDVVPIKIVDGNGDVVYEGTTELTRYGTFSGSFELGSEAVLGYYNLQINIGEDEGYGYYREGGGVSFSVAEYRLPEFQVNASAEPSEVVQGDTLRVAFDGRYFFGGAVSNAQVNYSVSAEPYFFTYEGKERYDFVDINYDSGPGEDLRYGGGFNLVADGTGTTDAEGRFTVEIPAQIDEERTSQTFTVEATLTDESDQVVSGRAQVVVHRGLVYVGARSLRYVAQEGQASELEVIVVDWESQPQADQDVEVSIVERRWSSVQERDDRGNTTWTYEVEEIPVLDAQTVTTNEDGTAGLSFTPPRGGVYKLIASTRDTRGNTIVTSTMFWAAGRDYVPWRQQNSNRIDLIADKTDYEIGDTAQILITSPFQGSAEALITVERGGVLSAERVTLDTNSYVYELAITEDLAPNVFIGALIIKGVDESNPVAAFRMGYVQLGVDASRKALNITIESDVDQAQPQQTVTYTVRTTDHQGQPVPAEVGVAVTDLAALSLMPPNSLPIFNAFYSQQALAIRTALGLTINTDQLTQEVLDTIKGGGGGGLAVEGVFEVRGEFVDTPYWNATLETDANGQASFEVRLPDNLTTWRLDARALTLAQDGEMLVGQDTFDLLSTRPLIVRPSTPRFFVVGDEAVLAAVVNNNSGSDQEVVLGLQIEGAALQDPVEQRVTVPNGGRGRVTWRVTAQDVANVRAVFTADAGELRDASISGVSLDDEGSLPVYRYEVPETIGTSGLLRSADSRVEVIVLPRRLETSRGELSVTVDHSLASAALDTLRVMERSSRYYSIESIISTMLPNLAVRRVLDEAGQSNPDLAQRVDRQVNQALQRLYAEQKSNGGWGWTLSEESDLLTTAWAIVGLSEARDQGYAVVDGVIDRAADFVNRNLVAISINTPQWRLNRQAFMLYALAQAGRPSTANMSNLYDNRARLSLYAQALLALSFQAASGSEERINSLISELVGDAILSASGAQWQEESRDFYNWGSDTRTTAIVLRALMAITPDNDLIANGIRHLMVQRRADLWETDQETAWSLLALADWMAISGELQPNFVYTTSFNGAPALDTTRVTPTDAASAQSFSVAREDLQASNRLEITRLDPAEGTPNGALYYRAFLRLFLPAAQVEALSRGLTLERRYSLLNDPQERPITSARVGDLVRVTLTIVAPNDLYYLVIEDPYPGGMEAVNANLSTSQQLGTGDEVVRNGEDAWWAGWYFRDIQLRDEKAILSTSYLSSGTYEYSYTLRAGYSGAFQVIPTTGQETYFPDVYARTDGLLFTIEP